MDPEGEPQGHEGQDWQAEVWQSAKAHLAKVAELEAKHTDTEKKSPLERAFGAIIDKLLLSEGILKVTPDSREFCFSSSARRWWMRQRGASATERRERNAAGDYSPDPKSERFPAFVRPETMAAAPSPSPGRRLARRFA